MLSENIKGFVDLIDVVELDSTAQFEDDDEAERFVEIQVNIVKSLTLISAHGEHIFLFG